MREWNFNRANLKGTRKRSPPSLGRVVPLPASHRPPWRQSKRVELLPPPSAVAFLRPILLESDDNIGRLSTAERKREAERKGGRVATAKNASELKRHRKNPRPIPLPTPEARPPSHSPVSVSSNRGYRPCKAGKNTVSGCCYRLSFLQPALSLSVPLFVRSGDFKSGGDVNVAIQSEL